ncbi:hypothetical protein NUU61_002718 [Penicillium alfredii]|uniref:Fungal STAND N-terminal Goodbye domain-containing protein n=1 Tax=Penicillium alfredii TaxID=1506179 RepID=A0A9W9FS03_9EURO|nr:uncharacterized protein NUU61_002718 [Penicillium alfredii]KAJ5105371.1 hypothetical protein NUU61_002718 [Penicillium alfredii]
MVRPKVDPKLLRGCRFPTPRIPDGASSGPDRMTQAVATASRLKPEVRLAQVVSHFKADLSSRQKAGFGADRSKALESLPGIQDVMQLTAEIDRMTRKGSRCLGPRVTNLLQAAQQFAVLGNIIAIVRLSLLLATKFFSYLEKLSTLLMAVGRHAPRHEKLALLYPRSRDLQSSLCEYFIVVVRLCHDMLKFTQKSTLGKVGSTLSDSDPKSYQTELDTWANTINDEVSFLIA